MSLACVGSTRTVPATLGLPPLWRVNFPRLHCSGSRLLYRERALSCVHFPDLSRSGSSFRVLHKSTDSVGPAFCAFPARAAQAARSLTSTLPGCGSPSPLRRPSRSFPAHRLGAPCDCSGELVSSRGPPGKCQPSRI